jgi:hypothetical protein
MVGMEIFDPATDEVGSIRSEHSHGAVSPRRRV